MPNNNSKIISNYKESLKQQLYKEIEKYVTRKIRNKNSYVHKELRVKDMIKTGMLIVTKGAVLGSAVPGVGEVIGGAGGLVGGVVYVMYSLIQKERYNRKLDNAKKVLKLTPEEAELAQIIESIAERAIDDRATALSNLSQPENEMDRIVGSLARHLMTSIRDTQDLVSGSDTKAKIRKIIDNLPAMNSKRAKRSESTFVFFREKRLETKEKGGSYSVKGIIENTKEKYQQEIVSDASRTMRPCKK